MVTIGHVDWALAAVVAVSVVVGLWRGLTFEVLALGGWLAAYCIAQAYGRDVAVWVPVGAPQSGMNTAAGFVLTFVGSLLVWSLMASMLRRLVTASPLNVLDRVLGGCFGLLRGVVVLLVLVTLVTLTPAGRSPAWQSSHGAAWLGGMLQSIKPMWQGAGHHASGHHDAISFIQRD